MNLVFVFGIWGKSFGDSIIFWEWFGSVGQRCLSDDERRIGGLFYKSDPATPWLIVRVQNNVL